MIDEIQNFKNYLTQVITIDNKSFDMSIEYLKIERICKGEYFVKDGQVCSKIAYIHEGLFRIYYLKDGIEINTCFCNEDSITSSFNSFINHIPSNENIQALENSVVVTLSFENLEKLYLESPIWQTISRLLTEKECLRLSDRASSLSFESAMEKYKNLLKYQPEIIQRASVQHIASYIGVSRETLSRIRAKIG
ncbi:MAG: Crp/Fnr family transcriptional regulator [Bacteroidota bacterium]